MIVDASTRIRLEGHLETVERQLAEWRDAAAALKLDGWAHDARWLSLPPSAAEAAESVRVVSSKLGNDGLLRELAAAQALTAKRAASRLTALGHPATTADPLELLRELKRCRPLHIVHGQLSGSRMDLGGRLFVAGFAGFGVWLVLTLARITIDPEHFTPSSLERLVLAFGTVVPPLAWVIRSHVRSRRRWVLTEEKLISEGGTPGAIALPHLELLTVTAEWSEWQVSTRSSQSPPLEPVTTPVHPKELLAQLEKQGVTVEVR